MFQPFGGKRASTSLYEMASPKKPRLNGVGVRIGRPIRYFYRYVYQCIISLVSVPIWKFPSWCILIWNQTTYFPRDKNCNSPPHTILYPVKVKGEVINVFLPLSGRQRAFFRVISSLMVYKSEYKGGLFADKILVCDSLISIPQPSLICVGKKMRRDRERR